MLFVSLYLQKDETRQEREKPMSKKKPLQLWRGDGPQPSEYDKQRDPMHGDRAGDEVQDSYCTRIALAIKSWMANKAAKSFDDSIRNIKLDWIQAGGSILNFEKIQEKAFLVSGYYKMLMKI